MKIVVVLINTNTIIGVTRMGRLTLKFVMWIGLALVTPQMEIKLHLHFFLVLEKGWGRWQVKQNSCKKSGVIINRNIGHAPNQRTIQAFRHP